MYAHFPSELGALSTKLSRVQSDYQRALSRGDSERIHRCRLEMQAIIAERDRLLLRRLQSPRPATGPLHASV